MCYDLVSGPLGEQWKILTLKHSVLTAIVNSHTCHSAWINVKGRMDWFILLLHFACISLNFCMHVSWNKLNKEESLEKNCTLLLVVITICHIGTEFKSFNQKSRGILDHLYSFCIEHKLDSFQGYLREFFDKYSSYQQIKIASNNTEHPAKQEQKSFIFDILK